MRIKILFCLMLASIAFLPACSKTADIKVLKRFPLDDVSEVITKESVLIDINTASDQKGSLKISASVPTVIKLFETGRLDVDNARLVYQARLRSADLKGKAYLEMLVDFPNGREFFSRGFNSPISGNVEWTTESIPFFLEKDQKPENVKLNLVVDGTGTIWVDDVRLLKVPLKDE